MIKTAKDFWSTPPALQYQERGRRIERHLHGNGYVSVVIAGSYVEAGDSGRRSVGPGDVLVHRAFEAHCDLIGSRGAAMINLPLPITEEDGLASGQIWDLDGFVRTVGTAPSISLETLLQAVRPAHARAFDWPDLLAAKLRQDWSTPLTSWADAHGLAPETVSRGFRLVYGCSPKSFRAAARARAAWMAILRGRDYADIVYDHGFTDQPHFCREILQLTGATPSAWRVKSIQDGRAGSR